jgi:cysteine/O-acetylserine efflux protein
MAIELIPLISFVLATTFSPGPNNISSASMGVLYGFRQTLKYLVGIVAGFFLVMLLCAWVSSMLLKFIPTIEPTLRIVGAVYILWLAAGTARASYDFKETGQPPMAFKMGFLLQALNPKVIIYGLTLYSTFLAAVANNPFILVVSAIFFAFTAFCATSTWALGGALIRKHLHQPKVRASVNFGLVLLLIYTAAELSGIIN